MPTFTAAAGNLEVHIKDSGGTERDFSSVADTVSVPHTSEAAETTTFNDTAQARIATLEDNSVSLSGPRDDTFDGYCYGLVGSNSRVRVFPEGSAASDYCYEGTAVWTSLGNDGAVADANRYSFEGSGDGRFQRIVVSSLP